MTVRGFATRPPLELRRFEGAWVREGRSIDGGAWREPSDVIWLQTPDGWFADVRRPRPGTAADHPLDAAQAFSGQLEIRATGEGDDPPAGLASVTSAPFADVTWVHDLDSDLARLERPSDAARLWPDEDRLLEVGPQYRERWRCLTGMHPDSEVLIRRERGQITARLVRVSQVVLIVRRDGTAEVFVGAVAPALADLQDRDLASDGWHRPADRGWQESR